MTLGELAAAAGYVVARRVAEHVVHGFGFRDVLGGLADDHGEFGFVVGAVVLLAEFGDGGWRGPWVGEGCVWFSGS